MEKKEFISVIITNFNKEKYIVNSLKSIMNQDYSNFEIIVLNELDGWISLCGQKRQPSSAKIIN